MILSLVYRTLGMNFMLFIHSSFHSRITQAYQALQDVVCSGVRKYHLAALGSPRRQFGVVVPEADRSPTSLLSYWMGCSFPKRARCTRVPARTITTTNRSRQGSGMVAAIITIISTIISGLAEYLTRLDIYSSHFCCLSFISS